MNLRAYANGVTSAVNPNLIGTLKQSTGYSYGGDASFTGSITGPALTVTAIASGSIALGANIAGPDIQGICTVQAFGTGHGGTGTYVISPNQEAASGPLTSSGSGSAAPQYNIITGVPMQFQALSNDDLEHVDGLNVSKVMRSVHINGRVEGVDRPGVRGGDLLLAPTGLANTLPALDVWLVTAAPENWDASGWSHVIVTLQADVQSQ